MNLTTGHKGFIVGLLAGILVYWIWQRRQAGA
jgi:hypothetical protein